VDWRVLAACEVVKDLEDEEKRKRTQKARTAAMQRELQAQLERNAERRAAERREKQAWMEAARAEAQKAAAAEAAERVAKHEKRLRDREMFREQAKLQRSQREAAHRAEALEEKREVDAAKKSLAEEAIKTEHEKAQSKTEQERLRLEIIAERKLKEERKFAEWRENARIDAEARAHREAEESRRAKVKAKRDARIEKFASMHARGAGKQQADAAAADQARVDQYLAEQKRKDEARHFADLRKIADTNAKIKVAQPRDIPRRAPLKSSFWCIFGVGRERLPDRPPPPRPRGGRRRGRGRSGNQPLSWTRLETLELGSILVGDMQRRGTSTSAQVKAEAKRMEAMQAHLRAEEETKETERLRKQREFQQILEEQAALARPKAQGAGRHDQRRAEVERAERQGYSTRSRAKTGPPQVSGQVNSFPQVQV